MKSTKVLIESTLNGSNIRHGGAHTISNESGLELIAIAQDNLEEIQNRLAELSKDKSGLDLFGIDYFLGAYLVGSVRKNCADSFTFLQMLSPEWLHCVIGSMSAFFRVTRFGYSCQVAPNDQLKSFLSWCCDHRDPRVANIAREVKEEFERPIPIWPPLEGVS
jgi:hypothetical protein